ncbi:ATP-dependent DNA helicase PIF1 [Artemisia annua]|uniref:ATP-dependent DNA helicase PIF1 n=1 Tax=Artemisia annua TaxID=35608 RepID=A0A2U1MCG6_ARTAN|nr:ATP-dependent DNA helicase PIF1 [Artemisia annua]
MRRQRHLLRISNAEKNQKPDNSMQASKPPEEPASQGMKILKKYNFCFYSFKRFQKASTQIEPVIIEGDMPAMCPQGCLKVRWLVIVFEELWWKFLLWFGWTKNKNRKDNSSTPSSPPMLTHQPDRHKDSVHYTNFLNSVRMYSLPQHTIKLKIGSHVMLTQNINRRVGLLAGTRLQVLRLGVNVIEAKIISGENVGMIYCIPRMLIISSGTKNSFKLDRRQFPFKIGLHALSINLHNLTTKVYDSGTVVELRRIDNDAFNLLKERSKSALELEYHLENIERAMSNDMDWLNPEDGEECNHEYSFDIGIEEPRDFPSEDFKYSGLTQSKDASSHPMDRAFLDTSNDVSLQIEPSSNSKRNHGVVKYFLPIGSIDELRGLIKVNEAENVRDEQTILGCVEAIDQ